MMTIQRELASQLLINRDQILGFILALTRNYDAAEEVFQEVSLAILDEAGNGKEVAAAEFLVWTREIARRRVAEYYRRQTKFQASAELSESMTETLGRVFAANQAALEKQQEQIGYLLNCIERLPDRSRQVVEGFYNHRRSIREIASGLGWREGSVKVALSRARKVLADCVQVQMNELH